MTIYEQPLNEKIRIFLRLERLIERFNFHMEDQPRRSSEAALMVLLEIYNLSARLDLKSEILKEIDRQAQVVKFQKSQGDLDDSTQDDVLETLGMATSKLYDIQGPLGQKLKSHGFFNILKQRSNLPGGINGFDVPMLHFWLNKPINSRLKDLDNWIEPYRLANEAVQIILLLMRGCALATDEMAKGGFYQSTLSRGCPYQLLRVELPSDVDYYPEVSAGKQRFSIRFVEVANMEERGKQVFEDISFKLTLCSF